MSNPQPLFSHELEPFELLMYRGESNPHTRSSMLVLVLLEKTPDFADLTDTYERASRVCVRLRQHVVMPSLPLVNARWVVDPDFDLAFHLRHVTLPSPGTMKEVLEYTNQFLWDPMDMTRPLWETILLEGIQEEGFEAALLMKTHHAMNDGISALHMFQELFDTQPDAPKRPMPLLPVPEEFTGREVLRQALLHRAGNLLPNFRKSLTQGLRRGSSWLSDPAESLEKLRQTAESAKRVMGKLPVEPSPLMRERSLNRQLDVFEVPLSSLRAAAKSHGGSVNDGYLAAVAGGLRLYHQRLGVDIDELAISMPVNTRKAGEMSGGNDFTGVRVILPIAETDVSRRVATIHARVRAAIAEPAQVLFNYLVPFAAALPDAALSGMAPSMFNADLQLSNVAGPPVPFYLNGCKLVKIYPIGPVPGVAGMITMLSMAGTCYLGLHLDTAAITDTELFRQCLEEGFAEVIGAASSRPARRKPPKRKKAGVKTGRRSSTAGEARS